MQYVHHVSRIMKFSYVKQQLRTEVERGVKILLESSRLKSLSSA